jgi:hypothetical protein
VIESVKENTFASGGRRRGSGIGSKQLIQDGSALHLESLVIDGVLPLLDLRSLCGEFPLDVKLCIGGLPCFFCNFVDAIGCCFVLVQPFKLTFSFVVLKASFTC